MIELANITEQGIRTEESGFVDLYWVPGVSKFSEALTTLYMTLLNKAERQKYQSFHFERDRRLFLTSRALLRTTLSRYYSHICPSSWSFRTNEFGKPFVEQIKNLYFNLSHTPGRVALVVSNVPWVGVDVQDHVSAGNIDELVSFFLTDTERNETNRLPQSERKVRMIDLWALKEAYIKGRGLGLSLPLKSFEFSFETEKDIRFNGGGLECTTEEWHFTSYRLDETSSLAVSLRGGVPICVNLFEGVPLQGFLKKTPTVIYQT